MPKVKHLKWNPHLDAKSYAKKFIKRLNQGDLFTYSIAYSLPEIKTFAKSLGVEIEYMNSTDHREIYEKYGCFTCRVFSTPKNRQKLIDLHERKKYRFDTKELVW